jgi:hypothetical protein
VVVAADQVLLRVGKIHKKGPLVTCVCAKMVVLAPQAIESSMGCIRLVFMQAVLVSYAVDVSGLKLQSLGVT